MIWEKLYCFIVLNRLGRVVTGFVDFHALTTHRMKSNTDASAAKVHLKMYFKNLQHVLKKLFLPRNELEISFFQTSSMSFKCIIVMAEFKKNHHYLDSKNFISIWKDSKY